MDAGIPRLGLFLGFELRTSCLRISAMLTLGPPSWLSMNSGHQRLRPSCPHGKHFTSYFLSPFVLGINNYSHKERDDMQKNKALRQRADRHVAEL